MLQENRCLGAYTKLSFVTILVPVLISIVITQFILSLGLSILTASLQLPIARTWKLSFCSYPVTLCDYTASPPPHCVNRQVHSALAWFWWPHHSYKLSGIYSLFSYHPDLSGNSTVYTVNECHSGRIG